MARTPTVSDEEIIGAATKIIVKRGSDAFTMTEVAAEVGLSRAAIILRFDSTGDLKETVLRGMVKKFSEQLALLPLEPGGNSLLTLAAHIGELAAAREGSASFFTAYNKHLGNAKLAKLEIQRGEALFDAISSAMPETSIDHDSAVAAFRAHLTGSIMAWIALVSGPESRNAGSYLIARTAEWLRLAGIPFDQSAIELRQKI